MLIVHAGKRKGEMFMAVKCLPSCACLQFHHIFPVTYLKESFLYRIAKKYFLNFYRTEPNFVIMTSSFPYAMYMYTCTCTKYVDQLCYHSVW